MADIRTQITRVRDAANDIAGTASDKIKERTEKALDTATDAYSTSVDKAGAAYADAKNRSQQVAGRANEIVQTHPIVAVAGAVAVGAVIAWMFPRSRAAMKALPAFASSAGVRVLEAAMAARAAAAESAGTIKETASDAFHAARDGASEAAASARETAASADLGGKASRLADDVVALVIDKVDAIGEALKARLPKR